MDTFDDERVEFLAPRGGKDLDDIARINGFCRRPGESDIMLRARLVEFWRGIYPGTAPCGGFCDCDFDERYG